VLPVPPFPPSAQISDQCGRGDKCPAKSTLPEKSKPGGARSAYRNQGASTRLEPFKATRQERFGDRRTFAGSKGPLRSACVNPAATALNQTNGSVPCGLNQNKDLRSQHRCYPLTGRSESCALRRRRVLLTSQLCFRAARLMGSFASTVLCTLPWASNVAPSRLRVSHRLARPDWSNAGRRSVGSMHTSHQIDH